MKKQFRPTLWFQITLLLLTVIGLRLVLAWIFGTEAADLAQYRWMANIILNNENIYKTAGLYHYTPIPMFLPAWSEQLAQAIKLPFHFVVKWPMVLADAGIALLLWWQAQKRGLPHAAIWIGLAYAINPVSLLTTSFHGSYSVLPAFFMLLAYYLVSFFPAKQYYRLSGLSLGMAIGLRGYPALFLPFFLMKMDLNRRQKAMFLLASILPSAITLAPFLLANFQAVWQSVFAYSGVADYGWIAILRAIGELTTGNRYLPGTLAKDLLSISKWLFLILYLLFTILFWRKQNRFSLLSGILATQLLFFGIYGGISSQYLVWAVPFALLIGTGWEKAFTWSAFATMVSFYLYFFPAILFGDVPIRWRELNPAVMPYYLVFNLAFWGICLAWIIRTITHPLPDIAICTHEAKYQQQD
ncbi:MAG TPA: hypothetical protein VN452_05630 [Longilinea sp.]|nr:hypothetical protein [Longilinea sp.]